MSGGGTSQETRLKTKRIEEFLSVVKKRGFGECAIYRGHKDFNWVLVARLFRDPDAKPVNKEGDKPHEVEEQLLGEHLSMEEAHRVEHRLLNDFSRYLYAYRPDLVCTVPGDDRDNNLRAMQEWRQLALAQHYGLPTRFIDFTTNMLVALFFAVEGPVAHRKLKRGRLQQQDSAVWCVKAPNRLKVWEVWKNKDVWLTPLEFAKEGSAPEIANFVDTAFVPEHFDARILAQGSVFMCEPRGKKYNWQLHKKLIEESHTLKIRIPRQARDSLREQLDLLGINRATLFPDLESAAKYLEWAVYQRKRPYSM
jgi:hypothetical protein